MKKHIAIVIALCSSGWACLPLLPAVDESFVNGTGSAGSGGGSGATGTGGSGGASVDTGPVEVRVTPNPAQVVVGYSTWLTATALDGGDNVVPGRTFSWQSMNEAVATVSNGQVFGLTLGPTTIRACDIGTDLCGDATLTVTPAGQLQEVVSVVISGAPAELPVGFDATLTATAYDANSNTINGVTFTWSSNNQGAATVVDGTVHGVADGWATISACAPGGRPCDDVPIHVFASVGPVVTVEVTPTDPSVAVDATVTLSAVAYSLGNPVTATFTWTSDDVSTATVLAGVVTGVAVGATTITACVTGTLSCDSSVVSVTPAVVGVSSVGLEAPTPLLRYGQTELLLATVTYSDSSSATTASLFDFSSTPSGIVSIDSGGTVTALARGAVTLYATLKSNGSYFGTAQINVEPSSITLACLAGSIAASGGATACSGTGHNGAGLAVEAVPVALVDLAATGYIDIFGGSVTGVADSDGSVMLTATYTGATGTGVSLQATTSLEVVGIAAIAVTVKSGPALDIGAPDQYLVSATTVTLTATLSRINGGAMPALSTYPVVWAVDEPLILGLAGAIEYLGGTAQAALSGSRIGTTTVRLTAGEASTSFPLGSMPASFSGSITASVEAGFQTTVAATARDDNDTPVAVLPSATVLWESSDQGKATLSATGLVNGSVLSTTVTGVAPGSTNVTLTLNGVRSPVITLSVGSPPVPNPTVAGNVLYLSGTNLFGAALSGAAVLGAGVDLGSVLLNGGLVEAGSPRFAFGPMLAAPARLVGIGEKAAGGQMLFARNDDGTLDELLPVTLSTGTRGVSTPGSLTAFGLTPVPMQPSLLVYADGGVAPLVNLHLFDTTTARHCRLVFSGFERAAPTADGRLVAIWQSNVYLISPPASIAAGYCGEEIEPLTTSGGYADHLLAGRLAGAASVVHTLALAAAPADTWELRTFDLADLGAAPVVTPFTETRPSFAGVFVVSRMGFLDGELVLQDGSGLYRLDPSMPVVTPIAGSAGFAIDTAR